MNKSNSLKRCDNFHSTRRTRLYNKLSKIHTRRVNAKFICVSECKTSPWWNAGTWDTSFWDWEPPKGNRRRTSGRRVSSSLYGFFQKIRNRWDTKESCPMSPWSNRPRQAELGFDARVLCPRRSLFRRGLPRLPVNCKKNNSCIFEEQSWQITYNKFLSDCFILYAILFVSFDSLLRIKAKNQ